MTTIPTDTSPRTENDAIIDLYSATHDAQQLDKRGIYLTSGPDGKRELIDIADRIRELDASIPARKRGQYTLTTAEDLIDYLAKHGQSHVTELWGNDKTGTVRAVINAHQTTLPGHEDHTATLHLPFTKDYTDWVKTDGKLISQTEFAEFIEDHLPNFTTPAAADMLELAQTFQATTKGTFESSHRVKTGETNLAFTNEHTATAGKKGTLTIPDTFAIAVRVYERADAYRITARFRYRITERGLLLGYRLDRIDDIRQAAFDAVTATITEQSGHTIWHTTT